MKISTETNIEIQIIKAAKGLSKDALKEVLTFTKGIKNSIKSSNRKRIKRTKSIHKDLRNLSSSELSHLEEEFKDYKKLYPLAK